MGGQFGELLQETTVFWFVLISAFIVAVVLIVQIRARYCGREDSEANQRQLLMQMGELHREGGLTDEEFRSIKGQMSGRRNDFIINFQHSVVHQDGREVDVRRGVGMEDLHDRQR